MNMFYSIKFRLSLWYLAILSVLLMLLGSGVYFTLSQVLYSNFDDTLKSRAEQFTEIRDIISIIAGGTFEGKAGEYVSFYYYENDRLKHISHKGISFPVNRELIDRALAGEYILSDIDLPGHGLYRFYISPFVPDNPDIRPDRFSEQRKGPDRAERDNNRSDHFPVKEERPKKPPGSDEKPDQRIEIRTAALVIANPTESIDSALQKLLEILLIAIPLTLVLSGGGGVFLARRALKPVGQIANTASEIEEGDLNRRIDVRTKDELGNLASVLNQMIARLQRAFARQKEFTSDASHELRAPLSIIQAEATLSLQKERKPEAYRKALEVISNESEHMAHLTNQLMELARADSGSEKYLFETFELGHYIQEICADVAILCREKDLHLCVSISTEIMIKGDEKSLRRVVFNILNNAIRYTGPDGAITVGVKAKHNMAVVIISDTGIGIPHDQLSHIFKRFFRIDKARSRDEGGSGLGLAICKTIMDAHGGTVDVESKVGKGSTFYIKLPLASHLHD